MALTGVCMTGHAQAGPVRVTHERGTVSIANQYCAIDLDLDTGRYRGRDLRAGLTVFADAGFSTDPGHRGWQDPAYTHAWSEEPVEDTFGRGTTLHLTHTPAKGFYLARALHVTLYEDQPFVVLGFSVTNPHPHAARVRYGILLDGAHLFEGRPIDRPQCLRGGAGAEPQAVEETLDLNAYNSVMLTGKVRGARRTVVAGGLKYRESLIRTLLASEGPTLTVRCEDPQGKRIEPGASYDFQDTVYLDFVSVDPFESLERYGLAMRAANDAAPNMYDFPTLCGWMVSTSRYGEGRPLNHSAGLVEQAQLARDSGITKYTPVAIRLEPDYYCYGDHGNTQQGWWDDEHWARYGSLVPPYDTMASFCRALAERGVIPLTYFQCSLPSNDFAAAHPAWMLDNDISLLHMEHSHHMPWVTYDYTDPGFQAHVLAVWQRLRADGIKGIKFDYPESAWAKDGGFEDPGYTTTSAYRKLFELCREGLGPDAFIHERNLGEYGTPRLDVCAGVVDLQRVWGDSSHFEPEMASRMGLRWYKNRVVFNYYPDGKSMVDPKTGEPLSVHARRSLLTLVGLLSGRLELGTSFGSLTPDMVHDITRLYPVLGEPKSFRPADMLMGRPHPEVYVYRVNPSWSQVILCNGEPEPREIRAPMSGLQYETGSLGLDPAHSYYVYDFWNDELVGRLAGDAILARPLEAGQALVYSVHKVLDRPQFLSTNRHVMQGLLELSAVTWDADRKVYSGTAEVVGGETLRITIALNGHAQPTVTVNEGVADVVATGEGLVELRIDSETNRAIRWELKF